MDLTHAKEYLFGLSSKDQALLLAQLSHELTVAARYYYSDEGNNPPRLTAALKQINEIQHRVSAQIGYILSGATEERFPADALIDVLFFWASSEESEPVAGHLMKALDRSAAHLESGRHRKS